MYNVLYSTPVQEDNNETIELNLSSFPQYQRDSRLSNSSLPNYTLPLPSSIKYLNFKLIVVGDIFVGKTSVLSRLISKKFTNDYHCSLGIECKRKTIHYDTYLHINLTLWDTCDEERFKAITRQYYRDSQGILLIFDLTDKQTFENLSHWLEDIKKIDDTLEIFVFGNKLDNSENRKVNLIEINEFLQNNNLQFYWEVSAKKGFDVDEVLSTIITALITKFQKNIDLYSHTKGESFVMSSKGNTSKWKNCC